MNSRYQEILERMAEDRINPYRGMASVGGKRKKHKSKSKGKGSLVGGYMLPGYMGEMSIYAGKANAEMKREMKKQKPFKKLM